MTEAATFADRPWREALVAAIAALRPAEGDRAPTDARRLLAHAMQRPWLDLIKDPQRRLTANEAERFASAVTRRQTGEPVARIIGLRGFYGRDFVVTPATLDPRPESETLIDAALQRIRPRWGAGAGLDILDIGTGTGCLLVTLLAELPQARGLGIDPSEPALAVAKDNAERLGVATRARWLKGRFEDVASGLRHRFPLVVSNPPYIPHSDISRLDRDVRDFDPHLALDGGMDGLDVYRAITASLKDTLAAGWVIFEIGSEQALDVIEIANNSLNPRQIGPIGVLSDMAGKPRCVAIAILDPSASK